MGAVAAGSLCVLIAAAFADGASPSAALAGSAKQQCLPKLLQPPHVVRGPVMLDPQKTEILIKARFVGVEGCDSWQRLGKFRVQIKQQGRWIGLNGDFWYPTEGREVPNKNEAHGFGFLDYATPDVHEECVRGHWQPARWQLRNIVVKTGTKEIVSQGEIKNYPVKIKPTSAC